MASEQKVSVLFQLKDNFSKGIKQSSVNVKDFAGQAVGAIDKVDKAFSGLGSKIGALGVGLSLGAATKDMIDLDDRMTRLGLTANASGEQVTALKQKLYEAAMSSDIKLDPTNILSGLEVVMTKTGNLKYAEDNIRNIGIAIQASGESGEAIGDVFSEFAKLGFSAEQITKLMDDMVTQSDKGEFTFAEFAKNAKGVISAYSVIGNSPEDIKRANAAMQILTAGTKSSEVAATVLNSSINELIDPKKRKELTKLGIQVRDSNGEMRDYNDILLDLAAASKDLQKADVINSLFGSETLKAIRAYDSELAHNIDTLLELGDTTGAMQRKSETMSGTLKSNLTNLRTAFNVFADKNLTGPLSSLTDMLNRLAANPKKFEEVFRAIKRGIISIALIKGTAGVINTFNSLKSLQTGSVGASAAALKPGAGAAPLPVYVTNWGGGIGAGGGTPAGMPGAASGVPTIKTAQSGFKFNSPNLKAAGGYAAAGVVLTAITALPDMAQELRNISNNYDMSLEEREKAKQEVFADNLATIGSSAVGTAIGAALGSIILPGIGTAVGAAVGGQLGPFLKDISKDFFKGDDITPEGMENRAALKTENYKRFAEASAFVPTLTEARINELPEIKNAFDKITIPQGATIPASALPKEIAQASIQGAPAKAELEGSATVNINLDISGQKPQVTGFNVVNNDTLLNLETGNTSRVFGGM